MEPERTSKIRGRRMRRWERGPYARLLGLRDRPGAVPCRQTRERQKEQEEGLVLAWEAPGLRGAPEGSLFIAPGESCWPRRENREHIPGTVTTAEKKMRGIPPAAAASDAADPAEDRLLFVRAL